MSLSGSFCVLTGLRELKADVARSRAEEDPPR